MPLMRPSEPDAASRCAIKASMPAPNEEYAPARAHGMWSDSMFSNLSGCYYELPNTCGDCASSLSFNSWQTLYVNAWQQRKNSKSAASMLPL